mgnify:CR=1 FL=1
MASRVFDLIGQEELRQATTVELIASENFVSSDVLRAVGSCLTNKYSEGYPAHREMDEVVEKEGWIFGRLPYRG